MSSLSRTYELIIKKARQHSSRIASADRFSCAVYRVSFYWICRVSIH